MSYRPLLNFRLGTYKAKAEQERLHSEGTAKQIPKNNNQWRASENGTRNGNSYKPK